MKKIIIAALLLLLNMEVSAGFLDMPEITEVPDLKRESLLRDIDIPSVRDRNPDPESGMRLAVSQFRIQGVVEFPELGITRKALQKIVEGIRFDMMDEEKQLASGYTQEELAELSDLIVEIEKETVDRHVGPLEVQRLVWLIRQQRASRGMTLGMIETVADKITNYYRERGFVLAKAYIPEQKVRGGVVNLTLLLGMLGEVDVNNNTLYKEKGLTAFFDDMLAQPVIDKMIEEKLYLLNDLPGLGVRGFFEPGHQVGDSKLNINIQSEKRFENNLRFDNHGSEKTGENRFYGEILLNNPGGLHDQLKVGALFTEKSTFGTLQYNNKFGFPRFNLSTSYTKNRFELARSGSVAIDLLELEGETEQLDIITSYKLRRSRKTNYSFDIAYEKINSLLVSTLEPEFLTSDETVKNLSLILNYDILRESSRMLHQGFLKYTDGKFIEEGKGILQTSAEGQYANFSILSFDYTLLTFWQLPFTKKEARFIMRSSMQFSDSELPNVSKFSLGGASRSRGYTVNQFSADRAAYVGFELIFNSPKFIDFPVAGTRFGRIVQPILFADIAYGELKALLAGEEDSHARLTGAGFGLQLNYKNKIRGKFLYASPTDHDFSSDTIDIDESDKIMFEVQYNFK